MASLLPLLHDLLPIFMPSKVQVTRGSEMVAVEERAETPPWYPPVDAHMAESNPPKDRDLDVDDTEASSLPRVASRVLSPILLLDHEEERAALVASPNGEGSVADRPNFTDEGSAVSSQRRGGPRVFRHNALVGVSDRMCVTGKPEGCVPRYFFSLS